MTPEEIKASPIIQFLIAQIAKWRPFTSGFIKLDNHNFFYLYEIKSELSVYDPKRYETLMYICENFFAQYKFSLNILSENELADGSRVLLDFDLKSVDYDKIKIEDEKTEINYII
jgi:hypothetical protein